MLQVIEENMANIFLRHVIHIKQYTGHFPKMLSLRKLWSLELQSKLSKVGRPDH